MIAVAASDGTLCVTHDQERRVDVFKWTGQFKHTFLRVHSFEVEDAYGQVVVDDHGFVYVTKRGAGRVDVYVTQREVVASAGGSGEQSPRMNRPYAICLMPDRRFIVSDYGNNHVQVLRFSYEK